jgi:hypothetical protein
MSAPVKDVRQRLLDRVRETETGCWEWQGYRTPAGYGQMCVNSKLNLTHRLAYELFVGPIPAGLHIDHLCRNRGCCNPDHLEPVTPGENSRRGDTGAHYGRRTHCGYGHAYTPENTYIHPRVGERVCKECRKEHSRAYRIRVKQRNLVAA